MDYSPHTPTHSRNHSLADSSPASSPNARRRSSLLDPSTPLQGSFNQQDGLDIGIFGSGGVHDGQSGLGNLADELADAFSESGEEDEYYEDGESGIRFAVQEDDDGETAEAVRDSGVDIASPSRDGSRPKSMSLNLPSPRRRGHRRAGSEYDGSEYGSESDLDSPGMPTSLVSRMNAVEALARRGTENTGGHSDGVFQRVTDGLKELGSQTGVESSASRLITAHSALTSHLTHQTRQVQSLAFPLLSPFVVPPDPETIDEILPLLLALSEEMPRPSTAAFHSISALQTLTSDLINSLNYVSDTLHMSRQTTTTAGRRLKSAKELVAEMRREDALREEGERWITEGDWGRRLESRECAAVCGDVVGGFEEVCNGWRAKLLAQAESAQA
ncbi:uncharacterized protein DNG_01886 [Cephalotrichum gorgonifer]|uniref:Uncharacterized protein n=1 Tax=Cephalotrichum gorgonifer TaxID=2041049 RepID=A0AAE8SS21_9PEZI|nr:uncharacterized protein DNG_01886 [Cephalotrichum gorgonifer]